MVSVPVAWVIKTACKREYARTHFKMDTTIIIINTPYDDKNTKLNIIFFNLFLLLL